MNVIRPSGPGSPVPPGSSSLERKRYRAAPAHHLGGILHEALAPVVDQYRLPPAAFRHEMPDGTAPWGGTAELRVFQGQTRGTRWPAHRPSRLRVGGESYSSPIRRNDNRALPRKTKNSPVGASNSVRPAIVRLPAAACDEALIVALKLFTAQVVVEGLHLEEARLVGAMHAAEMSARRKAAA